MKKFFAWLFNLIFWAVLSVSFAVVLSSHEQTSRGVRHPMFFGWSAAIVETGSMEPAIPAGSLIVIEKSDDLHIGDVVTYIDHLGRSITHRVVDLEGDFVTTKGDSNSLADPVFNSKAVVGTVRAHVSGLGFLVKGLDLSGVLIILSVALVLGAIVDWFVLFGKKTKQTIAERKVEVARKKYEREQIRREDYAYICKSVKSSKGFWIFLAAAVVGVVTALLLIVKRK
jgi:signal peptidase